MSSSDTPNPYLDIQHPIGFDRMTAEHVRPAVSALLADAQQRLDALQNDATPASYANTLLALEDVTERLGRAMGVISHLESVANTPELREAYNEVQPKVSAFYSSIPLSSGVYQRLKQFAESSAAAQLDATRARFLQKTLESFEREGAGLPDSGKERLQALNVELTELTTRFSQNVLDATNAFELCIEDRAQLAGLPERAVDAARENARSKGKTGYRFTLHEPSLVPVLTHLDDTAIREQVYRAYNARGGGGQYDNRQIVERILALRAEKAHLLGYRNFVDLVVDDRMAKTSDRARAFLEDLEARSRITFKREQDELFGFRRQLEGAGAAALAPWDVGYYAEKERSQRYAFDEEALRPYFALSNVLAGLFDLVHRLYGIRVEAEDTLPTWHSSVRGFRMSDADGSQLGVFYADLYPREQKRGGAWMNAFITGEPVASAGDTAPALRGGASDTAPALRGGASDTAPALRGGASDTAPALRGGASGWTPHVGLICANVTPPIGDQPVLLSHREVQTIFHEFGHLLHHMLSRVEVKSLAGTSVAWDFVELPSQIMENFCWERASLDLFARHVQSGERIPDELFARMCRARTYRGASAMLRQVGFGLVDLLLHIEYDRARDGDVLGYGRKVLSAFMPAPPRDDYALLTSFGHLFSHPVGYAGGYYSYKWAEVLDADAFARFRAQGLFSREVGLEFRNKVLARGDSRDPMQLFVDFMGREPDLQPLLERSGIEADAAA